jgi:hypothetical protein
MAGGDQVRKYQTDLMAPTMVCPKGQIGLDLATMS